MGDRMADEGALFINNASDASAKEPPARSSYSALVRRRTSQLLSDLLRLHGFGEQNERLTAKITGRGCVNEYMRCICVCFCVVALTAVRARLCVPESLKQHRYLDTNEKQVERMYTGLADKFVTHAMAGAARQLQALYQQFIDVVHAQPPTFLRVRKVFGSRSLWWVVGFWPHN